MTEETIGRPRPLIAALPAYRPGKGAKQAEQEHGITNAIKLASNENPDEPLDPIVAAVAAAAHGINRYPDHRATAVREAIAARLGLGVDRVSIGTGSSGLLQQFVFEHHRRDASAAGHRDPVEEGAGVGLGGRVHGCGQASGRHRCGHRDGPSQQVACA